MTDLEKYRLMQSLIALPDHDFIEVLADALHARSGRYLRMCLVGFSAADSKTLEKREIVFFAPNYSNWAPENDGDGYYVGECCVPLLSFSVHCLCPVCRSHVELTEFENADLRVKDSLFRIISRKRGATVLRFGLAGEFECFEDAQRCARGIAQNSATEVHVRRAGDHLWHVLTETDRDGDGNLEEMTLREALAGCEDSSGRIYLGDGIYI